MKKLTPLILAIILLFARELHAQQQNSVPSQAYLWKSVQVVGGGFVDGIVFHPTAKDIRYCRTDMGGAYRWDAALGRWEPMTDWITYADNNLVGIESIAVDPNDPATVYLSAGTYTRSPNGAVFISNDGGRTFRRVDMPFTMGGNENGRGNGERMMVDPADSETIYLGTRLDGLWRSRDEGVSWQPVSSFPDVTEAAPSAGGGFGGGASRGSGVIFVHFDPATAVQGKGCSTIYVGVSLMGRDNLFVSRDFGESWSAVAGQPVEFRPTHAAFASDGNLYITYGTNPGPARMENGAVWRYNTKTGAWKEISPAKPDPEKDLRFGYASVAVDPNNPKHVIVSSFNKGVVDRPAEDDIFRSTDGGESWKPVFAGKVEFDHSNAPYTQYTPIHWMFDVEIDPFDADHAMFTTGYGGWETFNLTDQDKGGTVKWQIMSKGIEETVPLELYSPPAGAHLINGIGDYGGFTHFDLDAPDPKGGHSSPWFGNTNGIAGAELKPELVVRVGTVSGHHREGKPIAYSQDGGVNWIEPATLPAENLRNGHIAVSADGETWIWTPDRSPVFYTRDRGATWHQSEGIAATTRVIADRVNPARFYGLDIMTGTLYESTDRGASFSAQQILTPLVQSAPDGGQPRQQLQRNSRGDNRGGQDRVYATPGREGDLWIAAYDGLYHMKAGGMPVQKDKVRMMLGFGFGKAAPGADHPALYMIGIVNGVYGFFRSDDAAQTWVRINDDDHQYGLVLHITGDPKQYGRVYVGTHGRGTIYGDPIH